MQTLLGHALIALAALTTILPGRAEAVPLTHTPLDALCLSAEAPAACHRSSGASRPGHSFDYDLSSVLGGGDTITGAQLLLDLWDDKGRSDGSEKINIALDGVLLFHNADVQHDVRIELSDLSDLSLLDDGRLGVTLTARRGDFFFGGSTLTLSVESGGPLASSVGALANGATAPAPAPAPLVLLGLGLTVLAWRRRAGHRPRCTLARRLAGLEGAAKR
ncbi:MAG: hypothetical protein HYV93_15895 [Candidatus Rokubacteria bacterium]|nr:hypothetical protein [Candidatus Rokubacteria bacterium]